MARRLRAWDVARRFPGTLGITALTILFFVLEHALGGGTDLRAQLRLGALRPDRVSEHFEVWRLVMPMFLHHGLVHLVLNGFALIQLGPLVESLWGTRRLLVFYVSCGIASSLVSAAFSPAGYAGGVGASGAIMGLAGVLLGTTWFGEESVRAFLVDLLGRRLLHGVLLTLALGMGLWLILPIVDNWGHLGGLACGLLIALAHPDPIDRNDVEATAGSFAAVAILALAMGFTAVNGGRILETYDIDTARILSVRASQQQGGLQEVQVLLEMVDRYDAAGASAEGLDRFERAIAKFDEVVWLRELAAGLTMQADAGSDRDAHIAVAFERWLALAPDDPQALNAAAWHLVTRSNVALRDPIRAERLSRESLARLPGQDDGPGGVLAWISPSTKELRSGYLDTLGEILFQQGRIAEAREVQAEAVALATELDLAVLPDLTERLAKIESAGPS